MNLTWHIVRKDLFRLRWILVLWVFLLVARIAMAEIQFSLGDAGVPFFLAAMITELGFIPLFAIGLVMGFMADDPVCDVDAFWITRPISGARLLTAKLSLFLAIPVVSALVALPWWLARGTSGGQVGISLYRTGSEALLAVAVAAPLAVLARDARRFVLNCIIAICLVLLGFFLFSFTEAAARFKSSAELATSRVIALIGIALVGSIIVTLHQILTRRTRRSVIVLAVIVVACFATALGWPWIFANAREPGAAPAEFGLDALPQLPAADSGPKTGIILAFRGLPDTDVAVLSPAVPAPRAAGSFGVVTISLADQLRLAANHVAAGQSISQRVSLEVPTPESATVEVTGLIYRLQRAIDVPVVMDAVSRTHGYALKVGYFDRYQPSGFAFPVSQSEPPPPGPMHIAFSFYFLVHPGDTRAWPVDLNTQLLPLESAQVHYTRGTASLVYKPGDVLPSNFNTWLTEARLVKVIAYPVATFSRKVAVRPPSSS